MSHAVFVTVTAIAATGAVQAQSLNGSGIAPTIVPSVGYCFNRFCSELAFIGGAGAMLTVGVTVP